MKNKDKIIIAIASVAILGCAVVIFGLKRKSNIKNERLDRIADEGYETAGDILYPITSKPRRRFRGDMDELKNSVY